MAPPKRLEHLEEKEGREGLHRKKWAETSTSKNQAKNDDLQPRNYTVAVVSLTKNKRKGTRNRCSIGFLQHVLQRGQQRVYCAQEDSFELSELFDENNIISEAAAHSPQLLE